MNDPQRAGNADRSSVYQGPPGRDVIQFEAVVGLFVEHGIDRIDLTKVNILGVRAPSPDHQDGLIGKIKHVQIQFHDIAQDSGARMDEIRRELAKDPLPYEYRFVWKGWARRDVGA